MRYLLLFFLVLLGVSEVHAETRESNAKSVVRIGILNYESKEVLGTKWQVLQEQLAQRLPGYRFDIRLLHNEALNLAVASRNVDFVLTTSGNYIQLHHLYGLASPLATIVRNHQGKPLRAYGGVIFTRKDRNDLQTLDDLSDQVIASIGTHGFAGYKLQAHTLLRHTGEVPDSRQLLVTGQPQDKVVEAVLNGKADAGFVRSGMLEALDRLGKIELDDLRVLNVQKLPGYPFLASTPLYPEWPIAAMPHTDRQITNDLVGVLLTLNQEQTPLSDHIFGFDVPANYLASEKLLRELRASPFDAPFDITVEDVWQNYKLHAIAIIIIALILLAGVAIFARLSVALSLARDAAEQQHQRLSNILWGTNAGTWEWDIPSGKTRFNERWAEIIGYTLSELQPISIDTWVNHSHPQDLERSNEALEAVFEKKVDAYECEVRMKHKDGHWVWVFDRGRVTKWSPDGKPIAMAGIHIDITQKKEAEKKLEHAATTDPLTGLFNRHALMERLHMAMAIQERHGGYLAIMYLDLDGFKDVNDKHGHEIGDQLLIEISRRLMRDVRGEDTAARMGGDEFVVILNGLPESDGYLTRVERLLAAVAQPAMLNGIELQVSCSIGITTYPQRNPCNVSELFRQADAAMYKAKLAGKNTYAFADVISDQSD